VKILGELLKTLQVYCPKMSQYFPQGGPTLSLPMDHPYQVWFNLVEQFYRKRLTCENLMDDRQQMPSNGKGSH
jgi:hypothetical protein